MTSTATTTRKPGTRAIRVGLKVAGGGIALMVLSLLLMTVADNIVLMLFPLALGALAAVGGAVAALAGLVARVVSS